MISFLIAAGPLLSDAMLDSEILLRKKNFVIVLKRKSVEFCVHFENNDANAVTKSLGCYVILKFHFRNNINNKE